MKSRVFVLLLVALFSTGALWAGGEAEEAVTLEDDRGPNWIADGVSFTYWTDLASRTAQTRQSHNEVDAYIKAAEMTGIDVKFVHPPVGQTTENFNLMIASGDLEDVIYHDWMIVPGGPQKAIDDGVIIKLNELVAEHAPNIAAFLNSRPDLAKQIVTDKGDLYVVPFLRWNELDRPEDGWQRFSTSAQLRADWLDELGLAIPETIAEWEEVLTAFKGMGDDVYPLASRNTGVYGIRHFLSAWGMNLEWYRVDGEIRYGAAQPELREFLTVMNRWYENGLIDPDFMSRPYAGLRTLVLEDRVGAYWGLLNSDMGGFTGLARQDGNSTFRLISAPWPRTEDGTSYNFGNDGGRVYPGSGAAISTANRNPVESIKWLDFWWGEDGHNLANFGIEGLTYEWVDGFPTYTDLIMNNPDGLAPVIALAKHAPDGAGGRAWRQDARYWEQMMALPEQFESGQMLARTGNVEREIPPITASESESRELAAIMSEVTTYRDEMILNFVTGTIPLSEFDTYMSTIKGMGIDRAIELKQAALDRYADRPVPQF